MKIPNRKSHARRTARQPSLSGCNLARLVLFMELFVDRSALGQPLK